MCKSMTIARRLLLSASLFLFTPLPVYAQTPPIFVENYSKPLKDLPPLPADIFDKQTTTYTENPYNDKTLSYAFRMPTLWTKAKDVTIGSGLSVRILSDLTRFYSPPSGDERSLFLVQGEDLDYQITAEEWLLQYMIANGYSMEGLKAYSDHRAEGLYVGVEGDTSFIIRAVLEINGKHAVLAQYKMPVENWDDNKQMQAQIIHSFKILNPVDIPVEDMKEYRFLDVAQISYPISWEVRPAAVKSIDIMGLELFNLGQKNEYGAQSRALNGKIRVALSTMQANETFETQLQKFKNDLKTSGVILKDAIKNGGVLKFDPAALKPTVEIYRATYEKNPQLEYEIWIGAFQKGDYNYFTVLETPSRNKDYPTWTRNSETFKLVVKNLKPSL